MLHPPSLPHLAGRYGVVWKAENNTSSATPNKSSAQGLVSATQACCGILGGLGRMIDPVLSAASSQVLPSFAADWDNEFRRLSALLLCASLCNHSPQLIRRAKMLHHKLHVPTSTVLFQFCTRPSATKSLLSLVPSFVAGLHLALSETEQLLAPGTIRQPGRAPLFDVRQGTKRTGDWCCCHLWKGLIFSLFHAIRSVTISSLIPYTYACLSAFPNTIEDRVFPIRFCLLSSVITVRE